MPSCCYISALMLNCFCLTKGRAAYFPPETIVASLLYLMVLSLKVLFNHTWNRQFVVLHYHMKEKLFESENTLPKATSQVVYWCLTDSYKKARGNWRAMSYSNPSTTGYNKYLLIKITLQESSLYFVKIYDILTSFFKLKIQEFCLYLTL